MTGDPCDLTTHASMKSYAKGTTLNWDWNKNRPAQGYRKIECPDCGYPKIVKEEQL